MRNTRFLLGSLLFLSANTLMSCVLNLPSKLKLSSFKNCKQSELNNFYSSLDTGSSLPSGFWKGAVILVKESHENYHVIGEYFLESLWKGKVFYQSTAKRGVLFNRILDVNQRRELFPAHVYKGLSLYDGENSIIIDYSNNQVIDGYRPGVDWTVSEKGLKIRDEIRYVHRGLYLGRAYSHGRFLLNFALEQGPR